jgi:ribosome-associated protein
MSSASDDIYVSRSIRIAAWEIQERFVRSSGPGGQHVNKVATAVQVHFDIKNSPSIPERVKARILNSGDSRLTKDGVLVILADGHRSQEANRRDVRQRIAAVIRKASEPRKARIPTRPTLGSKRRRLEQKNQRGHTKKLRNNNKISVE